MISFSFNYCGLMTVLNMLSVSCCAYVSVYSKFYLAERQASPRDNKGLDN